MVSPLIVYIKHKNRKSKKIMIIFINTVIDKQKKYTMLITKKKHTKIQIQTDT